MFSKIRKVPFKSVLSSQVFVSFDYLGGVFSQLRKSSSSSEEYLNLFNVTESCNGSGKKESVIDPSENLNWWTCGTPNYPQWIQIEMKNFYLTINGYILMSFEGCCSYPKTWKLEGKNREDDDWKLIDAVVNETDLNGSKIVKAYPNKILKSCTFRIFRLTVTDDTSGGDIFVSLNEIDFIGTISKVPNPHNSGNCFTKVVSCRSLNSFTQMLILCMAS